MTHLRLLQHQDSDGRRRLILADGEAAVFLSAPETTFELALLAIGEGVSLAVAARARRTDEGVDLAAALAGGRLLPAIDHPDAARLMLAGTGLTHLGSAEGRDAMHKAAAAKGVQTDSMRMFLEGVEGGKPAPGESGVQPEWFYKGDGRSLVGPEQPLTIPHFALDGGEEPEMAGIYLVGDDETVWRLGFALANEFSDHVTERHNYLWLAHSKLRQAALGAELLIGELPGDVRGTSRIRRGSEILWEKPFLTGEANMSHSIDNLEMHHFKYAACRRPGDVHVHFFGTATLSFSDDVRPEPGDIFEIQADPFKLALRNSLEKAPALSHSVHAL